MEAIVCSSCPSRLCKPAHFLLDVFQSPQLFDLVKILHEVVTQASFCHELGATLCSLLNANNIFSAPDPLLESLSHHDSVSHVPHSGQFSTLTVGGSDSHGLLPLLLALKSILQVLILILEIFSHHC